MIKATVLGSGTSTGVPTVACECETCCSADPRDKRLRTSLLVQTDTSTILIDTSADFRQQMLNHNILQLDAVLYTHHHFDHIGGFDDLRPFAFRHRKPVELFAMSQTLDVLKSTYPYAFGLVESTGASVPDVHVTLIDDEPFLAGDVQVTPIPLRHGASMRVNGYRFGSLAYCTDTNHIPKESMDLLIDLDVLIIDGLRWEPHPTHFTVDETLAVVEMLRPKRTYLTHIAHQILHDRDSKRLPDGVMFAYDGLAIESY